MQSLNRSHFLDEETNMIARKKRFTKTESAGKHLCERDQENSVDVREESPLAIRDYTEEGL